MRVEQQLADLRDQVDRMGRQVCAQQDRLDELGKKEIARTLREANLGMRQTRRLMQATVMRLTVMSEVLYYTAGAELFHRRARELIRLWTEDDDWWLAKGGWTINAWWAYLDRRVRDAA